MDDIIIHVIGKVLLLLLVKSRKNAVNLGNCSCPLKLYYIRRTINLIYVNISENRTISHLANIHKARLGKSKHREVRASLSKFSTYKKNIQKKYRKIVGGLSSLVGRSLDNNFT